MSPLPPRLSGIPFSPSSNFFSPSSGIPFRLGFFWILFLVSVFIDVLDGSDVGTLPDSLRPPLVRIPPPHSRTLEVPISPATIKVGDGSLGYWEAPLCHGWSSFLFLEINGGKRAHVHGNRGFLFSCLRKVTIKEELPQEEILLKT